MIAKAGSIFIYFFKKLIHKVYLLLKNKDIFSYWARIYKIGVHSFMSMNLALFVDRTKFDDFE